MGGFSAGDLVALKCEVDKRDMRLEDERYETGEAECLLCDEWDEQNDMRMHHNHGDGWVCMDCFETHGEGGASDSD